MGELLLLNKYSMMGQPGVYWLQVHGVWSDVWVIQNRYPISYVRHTISLFSSAASLPLYASAILLSPLSQSMSYVMLYSFTKFLS